MTTQPNFNARAASPAHSATQNVEDPQLPFKVEWEGEFDATSPREYLVKGLLPRKGVALLSGPSGAGKSFIAIELAGCLATWKPFFGKRALAGGTLILAAEGYDTLKERLYAWRKGKYVIDRQIAHFKGVEVEYVKNFPIAIASINSLNAQNIGEVLGMLSYVNARMLEKHGVPLRLIVVDTFAAAFALQDENSSTEVTRAMKLLQEISEKADALVMPVVHHGKTEGTGVRGSSAFEASADARLTVGYSKSEDGSVAGRRISLGKSRTEETGWCHNFRLEPELLGSDHDGDEIYSCTVSDLGPADTEGKRDTNEASRQRNDMLVAAYEKAAADKSLVDSEGWVLASVVKEEYLKQDPTADDGSPEAKRKRWDRLVKAAENANLIQVMGSRDERKIRKARTLDMDPPKGGGPSVH